MEPSGIPSPARSLARSTRQPGLTLGRYLGAGAMGSVYQASDPRRGTVAVKRAPRSCPPSVRGLHNELVALRGLRHTNLVQHHELLERDDESWLVMEYVAGETLDRWLQTRASSATLMDPTGCGRPSADLAGESPANTAALHRHGERPLRELFRQLASGVAFLHAAGSIHRDLKPENVVRSATRVVLIDFGLTTCLRMAARSDRSQGTLEYLPPECLRGEPPSAAADWYALGVMLHQALHGSLPRDHALRVSHEASSEPVVVSRAVPSDLAWLCARLSTATASQRAGRAEVERVLGPLTPGISLSRAS